MAIFIFSRAVRSGKTTELWNWCAPRRDVAGILMPDVHDCRLMYDIAAKIYFQAQCLQPDTADLVKVGKFSFYQKAFERANRILENAALHLSYRYIIIDELGKLELRREGFYAAAQPLLHQFQHPPPLLYERHIIVVVREDILPLFIQHFDLHTFYLIHHLNDLEAITNS
ncbi:MAG: hypothetical protein IPL35_11845 [Sphingobacteriales bacterium]|nr:hypothetical protein [Sphingobacteriales bacterium]